MFGLPYSPFTLLSPIVFAPSMRLAATEAREERSASIENVRSNLGGKGSKKMMKLLDDQGVKQEAKYLLFFADSAFRQWWQVQ